MLTSWVIPGLRASGGVQGRTASFRWRPQLPCPRCYSAPSNTKVERRRLRQQSALQDFVQVLC